MCEPSSVCSVFVNLLARRRGSRARPVLMSAAHGHYARWRKIFECDGNSRRRISTAAGTGADDPPSDHRDDGYGEAFLSGKSLGSGIGLYSRSIRHTLSAPFFRAFFSFMRKWPSR